MNSCDGGEGYKGQEQVTGEREGELMRAWSVCGLWWRRSRIFKGVGRIKESNMAKAFPLVKRDRNLLKPAQ